jgi:CheY-like chemotaxis protein
MRGVLIVEQSATTARDIASACQAVGLPVLGIARDGLEAVSMARQLSPSHVTVDLVLPRLPGLQVIEAMKRLGLDPITVVISAVTAREPIVAARAAGARAYLLKPIQQPKLAEIFGAARAGQDHPTAAHATL